MNERIKELSDKCGLAWTLKTEQDVKNLVEFVELIVRECISILYTERESPHGSERDFAIVNAALKIQRHFEGE